ncbi:MAG: hypothetical protein ABW008_07815, partial [Acidimicrobiales bacterium]
MLGQGAGEELQGLAGLGRLLAFEVDPPLGQEDAGLARNLEGHIRCAFGRELEDPGAVGEEPELGDQLAVQALGASPQLQHQERPQDRQVLEGGAVRGVLGQEGPLSLREELADGLPTEERRPHDRLGQGVLVGRRADEAAGQGVHLDHDVGLSPEGLGELGGHDGPQLHRRVVPLALAPAGPHDDAEPVQREVR